MTAGPQYFACLIAGLIYFHYLMALFFRIKWRMEDVGHILTKTSESKLFFPATPSAWQGKKHRSNNPGAFNEIASVEPHSQRQESNNSRICCQSWFAEAQCFRLFLIFSCDMPSVYYRSASFSDS